MPTRSFRRLATLSAAVGATVLGAAALHSVSASASESPESVYLAAINQERADHGLRPLVERHGLRAVASHWASHMAASQTLAHNPSLSTAVSNWQTLGENVGEGPDIHSLERAFWNSPEHRANILDSSYREVGIGAVTRDGIIWITIDFRDPMHMAPATSTQRSASAPHRTRSTRASHSTAGEWWRHQHRVLRLGSTGHDVARVQRRLHVSADGVFGPVTRGAVRHFQRHHQHRPTGVVGPRTWRAITR